MHELAVCQALIKTVLTIAQDRRATSVTDIYLSIGPLSGIEAQALRNAFPLAAADTLAHGAQLHLRETPATIFCSACGNQTQVPANRLVCTHCDNWRTQLVSGDELLLESVELEQPTAEVIH